MLDHLPSSTSYFLKGFLQQLSLASLFGFSAGACLKHVGRKAAIGVGALFIALNGLNYMGYINIHWARMEDDFVRHLDTDGDKKITFKDLQNHMKRFVPVAGNGTGFLLGAAVGIQYT